MSGKLNDVILLIIVIFAFQFEHSANCEAICTDRPWLYPTASSGTLKQTLFRSGTNVLEELKVTSLSGSFYRSLTTWLIILNHITSTSHAAKL